MRTNPPTLAPVALLILSLSLSPGCSSSSPSDGSGGASGSGGAPGSGGASGSGGELGTDASGDIASDDSGTGGMAGSGGASGSGGAAVTTPECTPATPAQGSCFKAGGGNSGLCDEYYQAGDVAFAMTTCMALGGTFTAGACPQANQIGTCMASNKHNAKVYYGTKGTEASFASFCKNAGDVWCPIAP